MALQLGHFHTKHEKKPNPSRGGDGKPTDLYLKRWPGCLQIGGPDFCFSAKVGQEGKNKPHI
jgi:hypothetical protein